jgi:hypothetical protein
MRSELILFFMKKDATVFLAPPFFNNGELSQDYTNPKASFLSALVKIKLVEGKKLAEELELLNKKYEFHCRQKLSNDELKKIDEEHQFESLKIESEKRCNRKKYEEEHSKIFEHKGVNYKYIEEDDVEGRRCYIFAADLEENKMIASETFQAFLEKKVSPHSKTVTVMSAGHGLPADDVNPHFTTSYRQGFEKDNLKKARLGAEDFYKMISNGLKANDVNIFSNFCYGFSMAEYLLEQDAKVFPNINQSIVFSDKDKNNPTYCNIRPEHLLHQTLNPYDLWANSNQFVHSVVKIGDKFHFTTIEEDEKEEAEINLNEKINPLYL